MTQNELFEIALTTDPAQIGHHVQGGYMTGIYPISDEIKAIGPAFTIRLPGTDNAMLYYAMKLAPKGSMIVIDRMGDKRIACLGEMVALSAKTLGMWTAPTPIPERSAPWDSRYFPRGAPA